MNRLRKMLLPWEQMDDAELVKEAQSGKQEAFGELIRRHRAKVYGYARTIVPEAHAAEDIVQDALIRAFLHLGKLVDVGRFLPWMHRIVRNQALTRLKRDALRKENTFTSLETGKREHGEPLEPWNRLDYVLMRVSSSMEQEAVQEGLPEERLMRQETQRVLLEIIDCLKPRERQIFEAHFFDQLSPAEIARQFDLSSANVYQILSRSRKKVIQERIRVTVDSYIRSRRDWGVMENVLLSEELFQEQEYSWSSGGHVLKLLAKAAGKDYSLAMVMGLTGLGFRIQIVPENVHIAGPTAFDFESVFSRGMRHLGFTTKVVNGMKPEIGVNASLLADSDTSIKAKGKRNIHQALPDALDVIHQALDRGYPVMGWDLFMPEFGILYGYDDELKQLNADEFGRKGTLAYDHLGRGVLEEIFILTVDESFPVTFKEQLRDAFHMILEHLRGEEPQIPAGTIKGLAAYDAWCDAFREGTVEPNGNAYNVAVYGDARKYAVQFLSEATKYLEEDEADNRQLCQLIREAADTYREIVRLFEELQRLFPFPSGGEPNEDDQARKAIVLLEQLHTLEWKGMTQLENGWMILN